MCGIVGSAGRMSQKHEWAFKDLLVVDVIRGPHSTGIASYDNNNGVRIVKKPLLPNDLFSMDETKKIFRNFNQVLMGHNRWATQGAINGINAHPFEFDDLFGAHNGTLVNQNLLPDSQDFEVDSENIFHSIQKLGVEETYKRIDGAAALVWFTPEDTTLHFLRNEERPMFITYTTDRETMFWASESWMLEGVLGKNGIEHTEIFDTAINTHYKLRIPQDTDPIPEGQKSRNYAFDKVEAEVLTPCENPTPKKQKQFSFQTNTTTTTGGTTSSSYVQGQEVYFVLDYESELTKPFIDCINFEEDTPVRVYCPKGSWLRKVLEDGDDKSDTVYGGTANGRVFRSNEEIVCIQENSVYTVAPDDVDWGDNDEEDPEAAANQCDISDYIQQEVFEHQRKVLARCGGSCGVCGEQTKPHEDNHILSEDAIICKDCVNLDIAKQYIKSY